MDFYTIDDLKGLVSSMSQGDIQLISKVDLLSQLDSRREVRCSSFVASPIERKIDFTISSPEFTFKQPSNVTAAKIADSLNTSKEFKRRLLIKKKLENPAGCTAKAAHVAPGIFKIESKNSVNVSSTDETQNSIETKSSDFTNQNPFTFNLTSGADVNGLAKGAAFVKRYTRPRRGATPHKSPPARSGGQNSTGFTSSSVAKENREPNSSNPELERNDFCFTPKQAAPGREESIPVTVHSPDGANFIPAHLSWPSKSSSQIGLDSTTPLNSNSAAASQAAAAVSGLTNLTSGERGAGSLTPQSVDSAMSLDSPREEKETPKNDSTGKAFQPQSLNFLFSTAPVRSSDEATEKEIPLMTTGLFNIGLSNVATKKEAGSPRKGQSQAQSESTHIQWLDQTFASVTLGDVKVNMEGNGMQPGKAEPMGSVSPFSSWWGGSTDSAEQLKRTELLFRSIPKAVGGDIPPDSPKDPSEPVPASCQSPSVGGSKDAFKPQPDMLFNSFSFVHEALPAAGTPGPFTSTSGPFTFTPTAAKTARPPSPKSTPQSAYIRRSKAASSLHRSDAQSHRRSTAGSEQHSAEGMDVDRSPVPCFSNAASPTLSSSSSPWGLKARTRSAAKTDNVKAASTPRKSTPFKAAPAAAPAVSASSDSESSDSSSSVQSSRYIPGKESCAPMSALKPRPFQCDYSKQNKPDPSAVPDESAERMNELANSYRKQGGDLYSREQYEQALDSFEKSLKFGSLTWANRSTVLGNRAATLMMLGRYLEAAEDCSKAIQVDPNMAKLNSRRGRALMRLGRFTEANEAFYLILESTSGSIHDLEAAKADARNGLKTLIAARSSMKRLGQLELTGDFRGVLALLEDLSAQCPSCAVVHASKCNVLCKLQRWADAKDCAEDFVCSSHSTIQALTAHPKAVLPVPAVSRLRWLENAVTNTVAVEVSAVVQAVLCMGAELGRPYVIALKNIEGCPNSCSDAMLHVLVILTQLSEIVSADSSTGSDWSWVSRELKCSKDSAHWKELGDKQFRTACLAEAAVSYTHAISSDPQAVRWSAILFNNRAASNMGQGRLAETVADCHQAISRDPGYAKAYLRRARALAASKSYAASIRDFRHYLSSTPAPGDSSQVTVELDGVIEANRREVRGDHVRHAWESRGDEQKKPGVDRSAPGGWAPNVPKSRYATAGANPPPKGASSSKSKSSKGWDSDEDLFTKAKQQQYQRCKASAHYRSTPHSFWGRSAAPSEESNDEEDCEDRNENKSSSSTGTARARNGGDGCHYYTLGVDALSSERQIKVAYRKLALKFHPDKNKEVGAEEQFKTITSAYSVLIDKSSRSEYDRTRKGLRHAW